MDSFTSACSSSFSSLSNDAALLRRGQVRPPQPLDKEYIAAAEPCWPRRQQARVMPPQLWKAATAGSTVARELHNHGGIS